MRPSNDHWLSSPTSRMATPTEPAVRRRTSAATRTCPTWSIARSPSTAPIQPGRMLYEIEGIPEDIAREAFRLAAAKLSVKTTFVVRTVR